MITFFEVIFLDEAFEFLKGLKKKQQNKILFNIRKTQTEYDATLFKKLTDDIWEFRTLYNGIQYRLLAFQDKTYDKKTFVVCTHGFIKKSSKVPEREIIKSKGIMKIYFSKK